jgi:ankyrin repeat protein
MCQYQSLLPLQAFLLSLLLLTTITAIIPPTSWKLNRNPRSRHSNYFALNGGGFGKKENSVKSSESQIESREERRLLQVKQKKRNPMAKYEIDMLSNNLFKAIKLYQLDKVADIIRRADLIETGVVVSQQNGGRSPLHIASEDHSNIDIVNLLLSRNASVDQLDKEGYSPLHVASMYGHIDIVNTLLRNNASVDQLGMEGYSSLYVASQNGHIDVVNTLLRNNASINLPNDQKATPLYVASQNGHIDVVKVLLRNKASVNQMTDRGRSPLHIASGHHGNIDIVNLLLSSNASVDQLDKEGYSPLCFASKNGYIDIVNTLLSNNASVDVFDNRGVSPLSFASQNGHIDIVNILLRNNASIDLPNGQGATSLSAAIFCGQIDIVNTLLRNNASVDLFDDQGVTPLITAIYYGHIDVVNALLNRNASMDQCDLQGVSPLHVAIYKGHIDIVTALLKRNASVNLIDGRGISPLYLAVQISDIDVVSKLLLSGAETNTKDNNGFSPLQMACCNILEFNQSDAKVLNSKTIAFELIKNNASMTKMDIALLSKFAIQNSSISNNSYLEILWDSSELRNSKKVEELRNFECTTLNIKEYLNYIQNLDRQEFPKECDEFLGVEQLKSLQSRVELRESIFEGKDWNWHHILLDSSYDSNTNQTMTALFEKERIDSGFSPGSTVLNYPIDIPESGENIEDQESLTGNLHILTLSP